MNWCDTWKAISARIEGIKEAGNLMALSMANGSADDGSIAKTWINPELAEIKTELENFLENNCNEIPIKARESLQRIAKDKNWLQEKASKNAKAIIQSISALIAFRSEFDYLIRDNEVEGCNRTERAFEHLCRLIVTDEEVNKKWKSKFETGETACEKLGAAHLLSHGIWAFKIDAEGARTDLVYNEKPLDEFSVRRTASTLVLTEWKKVTENNYFKKAADAKEQIRAYRSSALGDIELKRTHYIVLVSNKQLPNINDEIKGGITYRYINIPVDPDVPSKYARNTKENKNKLADAP